MTHWFAVARLLARPQWLKNLGRIRGRVLLLGCRVQYLNLTFKAVYFRIQVAVVVSVVLVVEEGAVEVVVRTHLHKARTSPKKAR